LNDPAITAPLVLPTDVVLTPVAELPERLREHLEHVDGDYAIARRRSRAPTRIVDSQAAKLLEEFRTATTIVQAVINFGLATGEDPREVLDASYPMLKRLLDSNVLVPADSGAAGEIIQSYAVGERIAGFTVLRCLHVLEDTELYQVRGASGQEAALKISRSDPTADLRRMLVREASILRHLEGSGSPGFLDEGEFEDRLYLAMGWCAGVPANTVAAEARELGGGEGRRQNLDLGWMILEQYALLHARDVVHSDVHQSNLLIAADGSIKIIDFGLARLPVASEPLNHAHRGGVGFYFEPECASALRAGRQPPESSFLGEQYALAAMLYFQFTGVHQLDYSLERDEMLRQISEDPMLPFSKRGVSAWPDVERILARALSKDPQARFSTVAEFAQVLRGVEVPGDRGVAARRGPTPTNGTSTAAEGVLRDVLERVRISGPLLKTGLARPTASVTYGAAGIAYALNRIARVRSDLALLALSDIWASRATHDLDDEAAFVNTDLQIVPEAVGAISPYHTASGVHCAQALIAHAMGDGPAQQGEIEHFIAASVAPCPDLDLTLGRSSSLLAASLLRDTAPDNDKLLAFGNARLAGIWEEVNAFPPIRDFADISYLGIAHGWAGILYATMRWAEVSGMAMPASLRERLDQLAKLAEHTGRGIRWPVYTESRSPKLEPYMAGWCHGSAGYVHLWMLAHRMFRDERYLTLAEGATWNAWEEPDANGSLCCGLAGRAYALLNVHRATGESEWLRRARHLGNKAAVGIRSRDVPVDSLYKGEIGIAVLAADLSKPEWSSMPFFEAEGWAATPA
jgi:serine/threonine protein kinase